MTVSDKVPAVSLDNVSRYFDVSAPWLQRVVSRAPKKTLRAVEGVTLEVAPGTTLALVGESGCGKSTLARVLAGLYTPTKGTVKIFGQDTAHMNAHETREMKRRVNMIFQDPYASLNPRWRVEDIIAEPLRVQQPDLPAAKVRERVLEVLDLVRLPVEALSKYPHQFSGGQRQRISIARAMTTRPDLLICDEPTSALDVSVQAQVLNLMKEVQKHTGMTYIFISHNLAVVHHMSDRVGVMYLGRLVELADKEELFARPLHPYTKMLLAAIPNSKKTGVSRTAVAGEVPSPLNPPTGCTFHPRCPKACEKCKTEVPELRAVKTEGMIRIVACHSPE